jgi:hypothetical protein
MTGTFRLFSTFLFSEAFELEVLLAKLHSESPIVERWVAVENTYTFKGATKPAGLAAHLAGDPRFEPFRERIIVVSLAQDLTAGFRYSAGERLELAARLALPGSDRWLARRQFAELRYFHAERRQRDAALAPLLEISGRRGWVVVTDVDEMLDGTHPVRVDAVVDGTRSGADVLALPRRRFVFDIDNEAVPRVRHVPLVALSALTGSDASLDRLRKSLFGVVPGPEHLVYEYSSCYSLEHITRKVAGYAHLGPGPDALGRSFECNHVPLPRAPTRLVPEDWYHRVDPESVGAPRYVLEHLEELRTGLVNPEYREARRRCYPRLFGHGTTP